MKKEIWKTCFDHESYISYPCPNCEVGALNPMPGKVQGQVFEKPPTFRYDYEAAVYYEDGEKKVFTALLICNNNDCQQAVGIVGEFINGYKDWSDEQMQSIWMSSYFPKYTYPNLRMFQYPASIPQDIEHEINLSFSNFFCDPSSAANKIRRSIELIVTKLGVPKFFVKKRVLRNTGRREMYEPTLHARIERLEKKKKKTGKMLGGLKVIGNDGSHSNSLKISHEDLLIAYEVLEHVINKEFSNKENEVLEKAEKLKNRR